MTPTQPVCRAVRLMAIRDIVSERAVTIEELVETFNVQRRTIYRDFADLQIAPLCVPLGCVQLWGTLEVLEKL